MRAVFVIAAKDLRERLRDRSVLLLAVVAPIVLTVLMNLAFSSTSMHFSMAVVDADQAQLGQHFVDDLHGKDLSGLIEVHTAATPLAAQQLIDKGTADAGFVVPAGFTATVESGHRASLTVLRRSDKPIAAGVADSLAASFTSRLNSVNLATQTAIAGGQPQSALQAMVAQVSQLPLPVSVVEKAGGTPIKTSSYFAAGMGTFFLFFTVSVMGRGLADERRQGTLARLLAAPISPSWILLGKVLSTFVVGCAAMGIMWAVSALAFNSPWGNPLAVVLLIVVIVLAAMGITAVVMTLARTDEAAERWAMIIAMLLATIGGNFTNLYSLPGPLTVVAQLTPNGQFLRSVTDLVSTAGGLATVLVPAGIIAAFAVVTGAIATARSGRMVQL